MAYTQVASKFPVIIDEEEFEVIIEKCDSYKYCVKINQELEIRRPIRRLFRSTKYETAHWTETVFTFYYQDSKLYKRLYEMNTCYSDEDFYVDLCKVACNSFIEKNMKDDAQNKKLKEWDGVIR